MSNSSQTLFQWQRSQKNQKPKPNLPTESGVSSWLTKLENRVDLESQSTRQRAAASSQSEAAYFEAKQLLQEWSTKRDPLVEELLMEERNAGLRNEVRRAWDNFEQQVASESIMPDAFDSDLDRDLYTKLLEMDTAEAGKHVANELLKKPIIKAEELDRLKRGENGPTDRDRFSAQRAKMEMRHAKVREMRMQREAERTKQLEERKHAQEVRERAHELVVAEERERTERALREEQLIRSEMSKIRAHFEQDRKQRTPQSTGPSDSKPKASISVKQKVPSQAGLDSPVSTSRQAWAKPRQNVKDGTPKFKNLVNTNDKEAAGDEDTKRDVDNEKLTQLESTSLRARQQAAEAELRRRMGEMRLVRRCFAAWFNEMLESRLKMAKITAIADFKLKRRCFVALRDAVRTRRVERELKEARRCAIQDAAADRHFRMQTLRKCFFALRRFANERISERLAEQIEAERRRRVENFLQHLALQQTPPFDEKPINTKSVKTQSVQNADSNVKLSPRPESERESDSEPEALSPTQQNAAAQSQRSANEEKVQANSKDAKTKLEESRSRRITEPWQVTKAMLKNNAPQQNQPGTNRSGSHRDRSLSREHSNVNATSPLPNNVIRTFESRQRNYQQVLSEQTRLIKEQKRLIEDLRSEQRAANIQAQLEREKLENDLLNKFSQLASNVQPAATGTAAPEPRSINTMESRFALRPSQPKVQSPPGKTATDNKSQSEEEGQSNKTLLKQAANEKMDDFTRRMQERAIERQRQRAEREERRRQIEEQRVLARQLEAAERERAEQEEKARRAAEARERTRLAKQQQQARIDALAHAAELNRRADEHRLRSLLKGAFMRWRRYVFVSLPNRIDIFRTFHQHKMLRRTLTAWHAVVESETLASRQKADALHRQLITRRCLRAWRRSRYLVEEQEHVAQNHYTTRLCRVAFNAWLQFTVQLQSLEFRNLRIADQHFDACLLKKAFQCWKRVPAIEKDERLREARLSEMRRKVLEVLPDFSKP